MVETTERLVLLLEAQNRDVLRKLRQIERQTATTFNRGSKNVRRFNHQLSKTASIAKTFAAGFAGGFGLSQLPGLVRAATQSMAQFAAEAERAGVGFQDFQELQYAASQSRVSIDALTDGLKELNLRADEFISTGKGSGAEAFQRLGFTAGQLEQQLKKPDKLFEDIIGRLQHLDRASQIRIADEIFGGTGGEQFVQFLDEGVEGIRKARQEARSLGFVMSDELGAEAERLDSQFQKLTQLIGTGFKRAVIAAFQGASVEASNFSGIIDTIVQDIAAVRNFIDDPSLLNFQTAIGAPIIGNERGQAMVDLRRKLLVSDGPKSFPGFEDLLQKRAKGAGSTSKLPGSKRLPSRGFSVPDTGAATRERQTEQIRRQIEELQRQKDAFSQTNVQARIANELARAGSHATEQQKQSITGLVTEIGQMEEKQSRANFMQQQLEQTAVSAFDSLTSQIKTGNDALDQFLQTMISVVAQAALFGSGPLSGLFGGGGGGGGLLGGLFSSFGGFFAKGGTLGAGKVGIAGENGPELIRGPAGITPMNQAAGGGGGQVVIQLAEGLVGTIVGKANENAIQIVAASAPSIAENAVGKTKKGIAKGDFDGSMGRYAARPTTRAR